MQLNNIETNPLRHTIHLLHTRIHKDAACQRPADSRRVRAQPLGRLQPARRALFALGAAVWSVYFLKNWKRYAARLAFRI